MPRALAVVRETLKAPLSGDERRWLVLDADAILGLDLDRVWTEVDGGDPGVQDETDPLPDAIRALVDARGAARTARDFGRADQLRTELLTLGYEVRRPA